MTGWKGTPGPWTVFGRLVLSPGDNVVADVRGPQQGNPDAAGIAAVPQLVASLLTVVQASRAHFGNGQWPEQEQHEWQAEAEEALKAAGVQL